MGLSSVRLGFSAGYFQSAAKELELAADALMDQSRNEPNLEKSAVTEYWSDQARTMAMYSRKMAKGLYEAKRKTHEYGL